MNRSKFVNKKEGKTYVISRFLEKGYRVHLLIQGADRPFPTFEVQENRKLVYRSFEKDKAIKIYSDVIREHLNCLLYV